MKPLALLFIAGCATMPDDMPEDSYRIGNSRLQKCRAQDAAQACVCVCDINHPWVLWRTPENEACTGACGGAR